MKRRRVPESVRGAVFILSIFVAANSPAFLRGFTSNWTFYGSRWEWQAIFWGVMLVDAGLLALAGWAYFGGRTRI
jgi:hypothetical protein